MNLTLRSGTAADEPFLRQLHRDAMQSHVVATWGSWDPVEQAWRFEKEPLEKHQIVFADSSPVGCLLVLQREDAVVLSRIWIAPEHQGHGIGTRLVMAVCEEATRNNRAVRLRVLKVNPALRLYARLGFRVVEETQTHLTMERGVREFTAPGFHVGCCSRFPRR